MPVYFMPEPVQEAPLARIERRKGESDARFTDRVDREAQRLHERLGATIIIKTACR